MANVNVNNILDANIGASANIDGRKVQPTHQIPYSQTGTVAADKQYVFHCRAATGTLLQVTASITETIATGADRTVDVDVQKSTGGGAFATVLSATIHFTNASTLYATSTATISDSTLITDDWLRVVITVAGAAGNQALGLAVSLHIREAAA